tara:strand:- start:3368 stop:3739 length:372 start_codon:yes stop_codon:yes gene_type:complete
MSRRRRRRLFARQKYVHFPSTQKTKVAFPSSLVALCLSSSTGVGGGSSLQLDLFPSLQKKTNQSHAFKVLSFFFVVVLVLVLWWWWRSFRSVKRNAVVSFRFVSFRFVRAARGLSTTTQEEAF